MAQTGSVKPLKAAMHPWQCITKKLQTDSSRPNEPNHVLQLPLIACV